jgi:hypothetical protein
VECLFMEGGSFPASTLSNNLHHLEKFQQAWFHTCSISKAYEKLTLRGFNWSDVRSFSFLGWHLDSERLLKIHANSGELNAGRARLTLPSLRLPDPRQAFCVLCEARRCLYCLSQS